MSYFGSVLWGGGLFGGAHGAIPFSTYGSYTLANLITEIQAILGDTGIFWTAEEITFAINEALHEWSADTSYWKNRAVFNTWAITNPQGNYYDLSTFTPYRPRKITIDRIVREIQYHLSESSNGVSGAGMSPQFSITEIVNAVIRARNRFCLEAQMPYNIHTITLSAAQAGRSTLPSSTIHLHRVAWTDSSNITTILERTDEFAADAHRPLWPLNMARKPYAYTTAEERRIEIQLIPAPEGAGVAEITTVDSQSFSTYDASTTLNVPDDFCHAIKYEALATLVSGDSENSNPLLVQYCRERFKAIVQAALQHRSVQRVLINGSLIPFVPLSSMDRSRPFWRTDVGRPDMAGALYDYVILDKRSVASYGVTVDLTQSAPVLVNPTDEIDLGVEDIPAILNYAIHYLSIKLGGNEFSSTMSLYDFFLGCAAGRNSIFSAQIRYLTPLFGQSYIERLQRPDAISTTSVGA